MKRRPSIIIPSFHIGGMSQQNRDHLFIIQNHPLMQQCPTGGPSITGLGGQFILRLRGEERRFE
jgi:hypothetical protein